MTKIGNFFHFSKFLGLKFLQSKQSQPPKKQKVSKKSLLGAKLTNT